MSDARVEESRGTRAVIAVGGLFLAVFFGAFGVLILRAPSSDPELPAWGVYAVRGFVFFMFGTMTAVGLGGVYAGLRGSAPPRVTGSLRARCPACGEARPARARTWDTCGFCGRAPDVLLRAWREMEHEGAAGRLLVAGIGAAIFSMGVVLVAAGVLGDREGLVARAGYATLALLCMALGALMTSSLAFLVLDTWRRHVRRELTLCVYEEPDRDPISAVATFERGKLSLRGGVARSRPLADVADRSPHDVTLPRLAGMLARVLAVLHTRGEVGLLWVETRGWAVAYGGALVRSEEVDVSLGPLFDAAEEEPVDGGQAVRRAIAAQPSARGLLAALRERDELRRELEVYAQQLPSGEADPHALRVLGAVLGEGEVGAPYRHPG